MLSPTDPYDDRAKLISAKGKRVENTCEWIKEDGVYQSWLNSRSQLLWISGGPGKGKTMISIFLTEELAKAVEPLEDGELIFYFCDNQDEKRNTAIAILGGLLYQILQKRPKLFRCILSDFQSKEKALYTISSLEALWRIFESMLRDPDFGTTYCVIDGLDECEEGSLQVFITKLSDFFLANGSRPTVGEFKLIVVSRELPVSMTRILSFFPRLKLDPDSDDKVNNDIKHFISVKVKELSAIEGFDDSLRDRIEKALLERAEGTFLWVGFVTNELLQKDTCTEVVETLESLPKGLPGIYSRMLLQIKPDRRNTAAFILRWVIMAVRPLTLTELAVAIEMRSVSIVNSDQTIQDYIRLCGAFVKVRDGVVGLVHQSARDYFLREAPNNDPILKRFRIKQEEANYELAQTCFEYIQNGAFSSDPINIKDALHLRKFPLLNYAALYWPEHARRCSNFGEEMFDLTGPFCQKKSLVFENWWRTYRKGTHKTWDTPETFSLLHLASYCGILPLARKLLAEKSWKTRLQKLENKKDSKGTTPLIYAAMNGHEAMVRLLLDRKANINAKDNYGQTALYRAACNGHEAVVQLLLDRKADVNVKDNDGWTALYRAAWNGHEAVVRLLLDRKADVNAKDNDGQTALHRAAWNGHEAVVRLLLDRKADVNVKDNDGWTVLYRAAWNGDEAVVQLLLDGKADVNAKDNDGQTALHRAAWNGHEAVVRLLLDRKADVNAKDNDGQTALHRAAWNGDEAVVQLLLDRKADVNVKDNYGQTVLYRAAWNRDEAVVRLLLDGKADVNAKDNYGQTALHRAAWNGHEAVVQLLLDRKADVNAKDNDGQTALYRAAWNRDEAVVQLLLDRKADVNAKDNDGRTALYRAAWSRDKAVVQLLLDRKADVNAKDNDGQTALHRAAWSRDEAVVRLLLDRNADVNAKDNDGRTALHRAAENWDEAVVRILQSAPQYQ